MAAKDFENIYLTGDTHADFRDLLNKAVKYGFMDYTPRTLEEIRKSAEVR